MDKNKTLVIMAAGMGSRFGGLKQIEPIGPNGEFIIDYSIYDAIKAGFSRVVFIIKEENFDIFKETVGNRVSNHIKVEYVFQKLENIPSGFEVPEGRVKPWGTTHALLSCKDILKEDPFVVCNADDFYGRNAFEKIIDFFHNGINDHTYCMVGYKVENTLSENGTVTRAYCQKDENEYLSSIREIMNIRWNKTHDGVEYEEDGEYKPMEMGSPVSMNFWGFLPSAIDKFEKIFVDELPKGIENNPMKYEALLPNHVGVMVKEGNCKVKVLTSEDSWFGVTYKEDKPVVVAKIQALKDNGTYPDELFK